MKQGYAPCPKRNRARTANGKSQAFVEDSLGSMEVKAMLDELGKNYPRPTLSARDVQAMLDHALGNRTLTGELYKLRHEEDCRAATILMENEVNYI